METRIAKKSRFQIVKLEELVAPVALASADAHAYAQGPFIASTATYTPRSLSLASFLMQRVRAATR